MRFNLIPFNPSSRVDPPKIRQEEITSLDAEQARALLDTAAESDDKFESLYVLSLTVGLRMGEALGLKWSDVDLEVGKLSVTRSLKITEDGLAFGAPKNQASRRSVPLNKTVVSALRAHRLR